MSDMHGPLAQAEAPGLSQRGRALWAKSEPVHHLWCHLLDVGTVATVLWDTILTLEWRRRLARMLGQSEEDARRLLVWLAALHDIGKATPQFQGLHEELKANVCADGLKVPAGLARLPHGDASEQILTPYLAQLWGGTDNRRCALMAAKSTAGHHGFPASNTVDHGWSLDSPLLKKTIEGCVDCWKDVQLELIRAVQTTLIDSDPPCPESPPADAALAFLDIAGFISFADWIGSAQDHFSFPALKERDHDLSLKQYREKAERRAKEALDAFGWKRVESPPEAADYNQLFQPRDGVFIPRPLQKCVAQILQDRPDTRLLLIEAPMGEGKTEAALYATAHWLRHFGPRGAYYALPTQATSNAMFHRVLDWFDRLGIGEADVHLLHSGFIKPEEYDTLLKQTLRQPDNQAPAFPPGYARLQPGRAANEPGPDPGPPPTAAPQDRASAARQRFDADTDEYQGAELFDPDRKDRGSELPGGATVHEWFLSAKRGLLAPFGTGTIDQALLAILLCRHHFVRLHGLSGKTVILDEVHAYDAYTGRLLDRLLDYLGALGCTVVLMSATLPAARRRELVNAFLGRKPGDPMGVDEQVYPRILSATRPEDGATCEVTCHHIQTSDEARKTVTVDWLPHDRTQALQELVARLGDGGCAAWVCNTVRNAQETYRAAKELKDAERLDHLYILHARYTAGQRAKLEAELLNTFGKDGMRPKGRALVIATQVIEQSLDVDFDLLASDLAPIDLLLQRVGRLHRHRRPGRPERHARPRLLVSPPCAVSDEEPPKFPKWHIYAESILLKTLALLRGRPELRVPEEVEAMIEEVYGENAPPRIPVAWRGDLATYLAEERRLLAGYRARAGMISLMSPGDEAYEDYWESLLDSHSVPDDEDDPLVHSDMRPMTRLGEDSIRVLCLYSDRAQKRFFFDQEMRQEVPRNLSGGGTVRRLLGHIASMTAGHLWRQGLREIDRCAKVLPGAERQGVLRKVKVLAFDDTGLCRLSRDTGCEIHWDREVGFWDDRSKR